MPNPIPQLAAFSLIIDSLKTGVLPNKNLKYVGSSKRRKPRIPAIAAALDTIETGLESFSSDADEHVNEQYERAKEELAPYRAALNNANSIIIALTRGLYKTGSLPRGVRVPRLFKRSASKTPPYSDRIVRLRQSLRGIESGLESLREVWLKENKEMRSGLDETLDETKDAAEEFQESYNPLGTFYRTLTSSLNAGSISTIASQLGVSAQPATVKKELQRRDQEIYTAAKRVVKDWDPNPIIKTLDAQEKDPHYTLTKDEIGEHTLIPAQSEDGSTPEPIPGTGYRARVDENDNLVDSISSLTEAEETVFNGGISIKTPERTQAIEALEAMDAMDTKLVEADTYRLFLSSAASNLRDHNFSASHGGKTFTDLAKDTEDFMTFFDPFEKLKAHYEGKLEIYNFAAQIEDVQVAYDRATAELKEEVAKYIDPDLRIRTKEELRDYKHNVYQLRQRVDAQSNFIPAHIQTVAALTQEESLNLQSLYQLLEQTESELNAQSGSGDNWDYAQQFIRGLSDISQWIDSHGISDQDVINGYDQAKKAWVHLEPLQNTSTSTEPKDPKVAELFTSQSEVSTLESLGISQDHLDKFKEYQGKGIPDKEPFRSRLGRPL